MSKILDLFIDEIKFKNRNPQNADILNLIADKSTNPQKELKKDTKLYRARLILKSDKNAIGTSNNFNGFDKENSFVAPAEKTSDMRANYKGKPCLYCSDSPYIAAVEVRPRIGSKISIATINVTKGLTLLDFTSECGGMATEKAELFKEISELFSIPITETDDISDYKPTQFIAEYVKNAGYDGIVFKSSLTPEKYDGGVLAEDVFNYVIFNYNGTCEVIKSNVMQTTNVDISLLQIDNREGLDIPSSILAALRKI